MSILNQNLLTLDFWKDEVTYAGHTLPTGSIGCAAMNISDEQIGQLVQLAIPLAAVVELIKDGTPTAEHLTAAKKSVLQITQMLRTIYPFSLFDFPADGHDIQQIFSQEYTDNAIAYIKAAQEIGMAAVFDEQYKKGVGMAAVFDEQYKKGVGIVKLISELAQLGGTLMIFKQGMIEFAHKLHDSKRTPEGYAETFAKHFSDTPTLSLDNSMWLQLTNTTMQYVSAVMPEKAIPQLVKRLHYVSFVGMLRSDLFEGLCVGHAPRLCPICGKWFLTTGARQTKYCGGLAPGDKLGRTCRQIGNLKGREQRELADDHPIRAIYNRRMNTITQYLRRGTLDKQTADMMKLLARDKFDLAIENVAYANGNYEKEMEQTALLKEARKKLNLEMSFNAGYNFKVDSKG